MNDIRNLENGVVASAAACNYGMKEEYIECARCGADITNRSQYKDIFEDTICYQCFLEQFGDEE